MENCLDFTKIFAISFISSVSCANFSTLTPPTYEGRDAGNRTFPQRTLLSIDTISRIILSIEKQQWGWRLQAVRLFVYHFRLGKGRSHQVMGSPTGFGHQGHRPRRDSLGGGGGYVLELQVQPFMRTSWTNRQTVILILNRIISSVIAKEIAFDCR